MAEDWRECVNWLVRCRALPDQNRLQSESASAIDLANALRDGRLLCVLLNTLRPGSVDHRDLALHTQSSQVRVSRYLMKGYLSWFLLSNVCYRYQKSSYQLLHFNWKPYYFSRGTFKINPMLLLVQRSFKRGSFCFWLWDHLLSLDLLCSNFLNKDSFHCWQLLLILFE